MIGGLSAARETGEIDISAGDGILGHDAGGHLRRNVQSERSRAGFNTNDGSTGMAGQIYERSACSNLENEFVDAQLTQIQIGLTSRSLDFSAKGI